MELGGAVQRHRGADDAADSALWLRCRVFRSAPMNKSGKPRTAKESQGSGLLLRLGRRLQPPAAAAQLPYPRVLAQQRRKRQAFADALLHGQRKQAYAVQPMLAAFYAAGCCRPAAAGGGRRRRARAAAGSCELVLASVGTEAGATVEQAGPCLQFYRQKNV